jgi:hypothetical protein
VVVVVGSCRYVRVRVRVYADPTGVVVVMLLLLLLVLLMLLLLLLLLLLLRRGSSMNLYGRRMFLARMGTGAEEPRNLTASCGASLAVRGKMTTEGQGQGRNGTAVDKQCRRQ